MNLNPIVASACDAQIFISNKSSFPCWLPIPAVRGCSTTSPKVAQASYVPHSEQLTPTFIATANLILVERIKGGRANFASSIRSWGISPSMLEITLPRTVWPLTIGWRLVKHFFTVLALSIFSSFACIHMRILPLKRSYWELAKRNLSEARETQASGLFADEYDELEAA